MRIHDQADKLEFEQISVSKYFVRKTTLNNFLFYSIWRREPEGTLTLMFSLKNPNDNCIVVSDWPGRKSAEFDSYSELLDALRPDVPEEIISSIRNEIPRR